MSVVRVASVGSDEGRRYVSAVSHVVHGGFSLSFIPVRGAGSGDSSAYF